MSIVTFGLGSAPATGGWGWWDTGEPAELYWPPFVQETDVTAELVAVQAAPVPLPTPLTGGGPLQTPGGGGALQTPMFPSSLQTPSQEDDDDGC